MEAACSAPPASSLVLQLLRMKSAESLPALNSTVTQERCSGLQQKRQVCVQNKTAAGGRHTPKDHRKLSPTPGGTKGEAQGFPQGDFY